MSVAKVIEIICEGKSIEEALNAGVREASKTVKDIKQIDVVHVHAHVENDKIVNYRVVAKVSFIVHH